MIGDLRTQALHQAPADTPIEDDTLLGLLILAFGCDNIAVGTGVGGAVRRQPMTTQVAVTTALGQKPATKTLTVSIRRTGPHVRPPDLQMHQPRNGRGAGALDLDDTVITHPSPDAPSVSPPAAWLRQAGAGSADCPPLDVAGCVGG